MNLYETFEKYRDEFLNFDQVENKLSRRPDLHALILLDRIFPGENDIISGAEHDEIFLSVDIEQLSKVATEEQLIELIRCGVRLDTKYDCLTMFV